MSQPDTSIIHFYRATVGHADTWRKRLDATTNWSIVTSVGVISFVFNAPKTPHFLILMLFVANLFFLLMEARRYQFYDIWRTRLDILHHHYFAPALTDDDSAPTRRRQADALKNLGEDLGESSPKINTTQALGFRIRRNYLYILMVTLGAWFLKLYIHPERPAGSWEVYLDRAAVGLMSGPAVIALVVAVSVIALVLALRAPSEYKIDWSTQPSPWKRLTSMQWFARPESGPRGMRATFYGARESPEGDELSSESSAPLADG